MFFIRSILALALLAGSFVLARDPSAEELDAVEAAFEAAGLMPQLIPEMDLEAFFLLAFVDANGTELLAAKDPGVALNSSVAGNPPVMATQGIHHLKGSRLVAFALNADDPINLLMFAQNLSVREDVPLPHLRSGAHLLNNQVTATPPADPFITPAATTSVQRLVFLAYKQPAVFEFTAPADRTNFDVVAFANETGLGLPVAATFVNFTI